MKKPLASFLFLLVLVFHSQALLAEDPDMLYRSGKYRQALSAYEQLDFAHPQDTRYRFNRGCAAYQMQDYKNAQAAFTSVYHRTDNDRERFSAAYNLGNAAFQAGDLKTAAASYEKALRLNPQDKDARYNLELALRKMEEEKRQDRKDQKQPENAAGQNQQKQNRQAGKDDTQEPQADKQKQDPRQGRRPMDKGAQKQDDPGSSRQPKDLSGELKGLNQAKPTEAPEKAGQKQQLSPLDRDKANTLLNNIREDRMSYLRFQVPDERRNGVRSGKYW